MSGNLDLYRRLAECPKEAQRTITAGKLKGKTDINPMWRIKRLTEEYGPVGFGWYTEIAEHWTERDGNETAAWVRVKLFVKGPDGSWSAPIEGVGGSKQYGSGQGDGLINDEAFKMAETDAISVACKKLGMAADVYWAADATKYTGREQVAAEVKAVKSAGAARAEAVKEAADPAKGRAKKGAEVLKQKPPITKAMIGVEGSLYERVASWLAGYKVEGGAIAQSALDSVKAAYTWESDDLFPRLVEEASRR